MDYTHYLSIAAGMLIAFGIGKLWKIATKELDDLDKDSSHIPAERSDYN